MRTPSASARRFHQFPRRFISVQVEEPAEEEKVSEAEKEEEDEEEEEEKTEDDLMASLGLPPGAT